MGKLVQGRLTQWKVCIVIRGMIRYDPCVTGVRSDPELRGVIPNAFDHIFTHIQRTENEQFLVRASYLEIYQVISCLYSKAYSKNVLSNLLCTFQPLYSMKEL